MRRTADDGKFIPIKKRAREYVVQALYKYLLSGRQQKVDEVMQQVEQHLTSLHAKPSEKAFFEHVFQGVVSSLSDIDAYIAGTFKGSFADMHYVEQAIIILAVYEMRVMKTPKRFLIAEALRLSDLFADESFYKKVNAYLDICE